MCRHDGKFFNELLCRLVTSPIFLCCYHLIARKIAELVDFNCGIRPFYTACCFGELSRGSVLCLLNASVRKAISKCHDSIFYAKIDDHGLCWGDMGQILAQWRHRMASNRLIHMAIELAHKVGAFFSVNNFLSCINVDERQSYGRLNI